MEGKAKGTRGPTASESITGRSDPLTHPHTPCTPVHTRTLTRTFTGIDTDASDSKEQVPRGTELTSSSNEFVATKLPFHGYLFGSPLLLVWYHSYLHSLHRLFSVPFPFSPSPSPSPSFLYSVLFSSTPALPYLTLEKHLENAKRKKSFGGLGPCITLILHTKDAGGLYYLM